MTIAVRECDEHLGYLLDKIDTNKNLHENLHLIVTSDHGMEQSMVQIIQSILKIILMKQKQKHLVYHQL